MASEKNDPTSIEIVSLDEYHTRRNRRVNSRLSQPSAASQKQQRSEAASEDRPVSNTRYDFSQIEIVSIDTYNARRRWRATTAPSPPPAQPASTDTRVKVKKLIIKKETLAQRCEICHKSDQFNPATGQCARCSNVISQVAVSRSSLNNSTPLPQFITNNIPGPRAKPGSNMLIDIVVDAFRYLRQSFNQLLQTHNIPPLKEALGLKDKQINSEKHSTDNLPTATKNN